MSKIKVIKGVGLCNPPHNQEIDKLIELTIFYHQKQLIYDD